MKLRTTFLALSLCISACQMSPTRVDNIPDPRSSESYKTFIAQGGIPDFPINAVIHFKPGLPRTSKALNSAVVYDAPKFESLDNFLVLVINTPQYKIQVIGYTDNHECQPEQCQKLSQARAEAVYALLVQKGVPVAKLEPPIGYGSSKPSTYNANEHDWQAERRVEIEMSRN